MSLQLEVVKRVYMNMYANRNLTMPHISDIPPQHSFVANATNLTLLRHSAYRRRYMQSAYEILTNI